MLHDLGRLPLQFARIYTLGYSLSGLEIPLLHVTDHGVSGSGKKSVVITGRIHPGESNSSLTLKGFIDFLCSDNAKAIEMRKMSNFYIIPMINPDGVVLGNSRCSASGSDLNRVFPEASKDLYPEIYLLRQFISKFLSSREILIYFDFHGHSRKKNTFFYGPSFPLSSPNYLKCRILPRII
jgi:murein tripeptide amidase MpaA